MRKVSKGIAAVLAILAMTCTSSFVGASCQEAPKLFSIVRNDSSVQITIEFRSGGAWQQIQIDSQKDTQIIGDGIRMATNRADNATITVELPIAGGKKYRIFWNTQSSMWDISSAG